MADEFDPYYSWLGIPPHEQPADHYRLLGITQLESNLDVIANAADARLTYVRGFQNGPRSALSQKILNEISAARVCLLDPKKKAPYDQQLQATLAAKKASGTSPATTTSAATSSASSATSVPKKVVPQAKPMAAAKPSAQNPDAPMPAIVTSPTAKAKPQAVPASPQAVKTQQPKWLPLAIVGGAVAVLLVIGGIVAVKLLQSPKRDVAVKKDEASPDTAAKENSAAVDNTAAKDKSVSANDNSTETETAKEKEKKKEKSNSATPPNSSADQPAVAVSPNPNGASQTPPTQPASRPTGMPLTSVVDLLRSLDIEANRRRGNATFDQAELLLGNAVQNSVSQVTFPNDVPTEYDFAIRVTHEEGEGGVVFGVVMDGYSCAAAVDGWKSIGFGSGYSVINQSPARVLHRGVVLTKNQPAELVVKVRRGALATYCDGRLLCQWRGEPSSLSLLSQYHRSNPPSLFLASWGSVYRIHKAELRPATDFPQLASADAPSPNAPQTTASSPSNTSPAPNAPAVVQPTSPGNVLRISGQQFIELANASELNATNGPRTYEAWIRIPNPNLDTCLFGSRTTGSGTSNTWRFSLGRQDYQLALQTHVLNDSKTNLYWYDSIGKTWNMGWHHVTLIVEPSLSFRMMLDGGMRGGLSPPNNGLAQRASGFWIGANPMIASTSNGDLEICAFRISQGIKYGKNFTPPVSFGRESDTLVLLDFANPAAGSIRDRSGNNHHGQLFGPRWSPFSNSSPSPSAVATATSPSSAPSSEPTSTPPTTPSTTLVPNSLDSVTKPKPPDATTRAKKLEEVKQLFGDEIAKAKKPDEKVAVANKLLREGKALNDDPASMFVMLDQARTVAAESGQLLLAMAAVNELESRFEFDPAAVKLDTLKKTVIPANANDVKRYFAETAFALAKSAAEAGQFDVASGAVELAHSGSLRAKLNDLAKASLDFKTELTRQRKLHEEIQAAEEKLKSNDRDGEANLKVGRFYALLRNDWKRGLAYLEKAGDDPFAKAAQLDQAASNPAAGNQAELQLKAAEAWDKLSESAEKSERFALQKRAHAWYSAALPFLAGLQKVRAQQRFDTLSELPGIAPEIHVKSSMTNANGQAMEVYLGLMGRVLVGGKDIGVVVKYDVGRNISSQKLDRLVQEGKGTGRQQLTIQLIGAVSQPNSNSVWALYGCGSNEGLTELRIDRRSFGIARPADSVNMSMSVQPGDHELTWALNGDTSGAQLRFPSSTRRVTPYYTHEMLDKLRRQVSKTGKPKEFSLHD